MTDKQEANPLAAGSATHAGGPTSIQIDLDSSEAARIALLICSLDEDAPNSPISLSIGEGQEGYGLYAWQTGYPDEGALLVKALDAAPLAAPQAQVQEPPTEKLTVWFGSMPESNGKTNWTAILHRGDIAEGLTLARSEHHDRVRYEADRARYLIGELAKEPFILDYDEHMLSPPASPTQPTQQEPL